MDLSVDLGELKLKNPVMVAAGPWARDAASIRRCVEAGAGAVITETLSLEANANLSPRLYVGGNGQLFNTKLYSNIQLEQWEMELETLERGDCRLIVSIWGSSASELSYLAERAERMGADAVEISVSAPIGTRNKSLSYHTPHLLECARAVVNTVGVPVLAKLSYEVGNSPEIMDALYQAGVRIVSAIDALKGISGVDVERRRALMPTYGGYSGENIRPAALATTAALRQYTPFRICGCGGVFTAENALEYLMLGADAVQLASVIQLRGYEAIAQVLAGLAAWLSAHGHEDLSRVRGAALPSLMPFEDVRPKPLTVVLREPCEDAACDLCIHGCLYGAVSRDEAGCIRIDPARCGGCGLCSARCPQRRIMLCWQQ